MSEHEVAYGSDNAELAAEVYNRQMSESHKAQRARLNSELVQQ